MQMTTIVVWTSAKLQHPFFSLSYIHRQSNYHNNYILQIITTTETQENSLGLRLSFMPSQYSHMGWYFCYVWTKYNTHTERVAVEFNVIETGKAKFNIISYFQSYDQSDYRKAVT